MLALADVAAALLACVFSTIVVGGDVAQLAWSLVFLPVWILVAKLLGLYDRDQRSFRHLTVDEAPQLVLWALIGTSSISFFLELTPAGRLNASSAVAIGAVAGVAGFVLRAVGRWLWRAVTPLERTMVVGTAANVAAVRRKLELFPDMHMTLVDEREALDDTTDGKGLEDVDRLVYAPSVLEESEVRAIIDVAHANRVMLFVVPPCRTLFGSAVQIHRVAELPLLTHGTIGPARSTLFLKRVLDFALSVIALLVLLPVFLAAAVAIKLDSRGPVLFRQVRIGRGGRPFMILKFRTMVADAAEQRGSVAHLNRHAAVDPRMFKAVNDPRVTRVGRLLRRFSLDELPQLFNVIRGEMTLVGPRPLVPEEDEFVTGLARVRSAVLPGITGLWQVNGASGLTFAEMVELDYDYVSALSLRRDLQLIVRTLPALVGRRAG
jgi:exopolysaccharide biosynthesis polyprenyl glycosylphosphotransferase